VPGRVNLIGEHIDYYNLPVLPMAIERRLTLAFTASLDGSVQVESAGFGGRELRLQDPLEPGAPGDYGNYLKAAVLAVQTKWQISKGFHGYVTSDLPSAAGLSSSSALITAFTLALLQANGIHARLDELMSVLPEGEHFVGTRGGGMDHAAVLAGRAGHALLVRFAPFSVEHVPLSPDWCFVVAHSLIRAEKSGDAKSRYNACRSAAPGLHATTEADRVSQAVAAIKANDREGFGRLLNASHASLRDRLQVSCESLDRIVEIAVNAGADGARLTGAGFGGCAIILCTMATRGTIVAALERDFYAAHPEYNRDEHMIFAQPSNGALYANH